AAQATQQPSSQTRNKCGRCTSFWWRLRSSRTEPPEDPVHDPVEEKVETPQIHTEKCRRHDYDKGRGVHFSTRRPRDTPRLITDFDEEVAAVFQPAFDSSCGCANW